MGIKTTAEYAFPLWPKYIIQKPSSVQRQAGWPNNAPCVDVGELTAEQIELLVENFREHCARRAATLKESE